MFYLRLIGTALRSLESHFLRSLLATVGVLIGVGSVVASMSILEGASNRIQKDFKSFGSSLLYVLPAEARVQGHVVGSSQTLRIPDGRLLLRELPDEVLAVAPVAFGSADLKHLQRSENYQVLATSDAYFEMNAYKAATGHIFNKNEAADAMSNVVCLGSKVADDLFGGMDPVGQTVKIRNVPYRIIAVMEKRGSIGFMNADEAVYIPIEAGLKRFFNREYLDTLTVQGAEGCNLEDLQRKVTTALKRAHNIRVGTPDDFRIFNQQQALEQVNSFTLIFRIVFYSIAGISLVVGGIGIMNIMLVSVTERTREIGVRMAVGARRSDILFQFLIEALIVSLLGGGTGVLLGWMMSDLLHRVLQGLIITEVSPKIVAVALITALAVGIVSGLYPAYQASRKDPVEALRYE